MNETLNALCILLALIGIAAVTAGWLIITFSRLFRQCWPDVLLCLLFIPAPLVAWKREQNHALWMLLYGTLLIVCGFAGTAFLAST